MATFGPGGGQFRLRHLLNPIYWYNFVVDVREEKRLKEQIEEEEKKKAEQLKEAEARRIEQQEREAREKEAKADADMVRRVQEREEELKARLQKEKEEAEKNKEEKEKEGPRASLVEEEKQEEKEGLKALEGEAVPPPEWKPSVSDKEKEIDQRMRLMEAELERLKKERLAFEQERKRFEEEKKAYEAGKQQEAGYAGRENNAPERETPAAVNQPAMKEAVQPEKDAVVSKKGNYTEMKLDDDSLTTKQADQTAKLKITADMSVLAKKSSKEFKMMQAAVDRFDKFMKGMQGRTTFTPEELEKYDKLSHDVYKASDTYLKKKQEDIDKRPLGKDGKSKKKSIYVV